MNATHDVDYDRPLVEAAQQDPRAFEQLYDRYLPRLYAYVAYRVGRAQDCEDLVANTFLKAVEALDRFEWRRSGSFAAWLFRIALNEVTDYHRRNRMAARHLPLDELPDLRAGDLAHSDLFPQPEDALLRKETFAHLRALLATLPPRRQDIITLRFFGGLRNSEIALALGLDERTVASHLCRGLKDLHRLYLQDTVPNMENP
ncbi:MAG: RNA polymerase sigma factor [Chloroflexia bacterium]